MGPAEVAARIFRTGHFPELHLQGVINEQSIRQGFPNPEDFLDRLGCLKDADRSGQHAQHASFLAVRHESGRRRLRVEASVAGIAFVGLDGGQLALKPEDAAGDERPLGEVTGVIQQESRREIVGAIQDDVILR